MIHQKPNSPLACEFIKFNFETVFLVNTKQKNRSIGWQIKSDWFSTLDLGFTLLPALVKLYYLWASTNPLVAKVIYFQKRGLTPLLLAFEFPIIRYFVSIEFCRPLDIHTHLFANYLSNATLHFTKFNVTLKPSLKIPFILWPRKLMISYWLLLSLWFGYSNNVKTISWKGHTGVMVLKKIFKNLSLTWKCIPKNIRNILYFWHLG